MKTLNVSFTPAQFARLSKSAAFIGGGVTVENLVVAGALGLLDFEGSLAADACEAIRADVEVYALKGAAFRDPKAGEGSGVQHAAEPTNGTVAFLRALDVHVARSDRSKAPGVVSTKGGRIAHLVNGRGNVERWKVTPKAISRMAS